MMKAHRIMNGIEKVKTRNFLFLVSKHKRIFNEIKLRRKTKEMPFYVIHNSTWYSATDCHYNV